MQATTRFPSSTWISGHRPAHGDAHGPFQAGIALVSAALAVLHALPNAIEALTMMAVDSADHELASAASALEIFIARTGTVGPCNLLVRGPKTGDEPFLVFGLARQPCGAVHIQPIEIDLESIALVASPMGALDQLRSAIADGNDRALVRVRLASLVARVRAATSRLSVVKARLDLQGSFLASVLAADSHTSLATLGSSLDGDGARKAAADTRRLLGARGLRIVGTDGTKLPVPSIVTTPS